MKKILALILALVTLFSLCACDGTPSEEDIRGEQIENKGSSESDEIIGESEFSLGSAKGTAYESKFIGIGCKFPEGWSFYDEEQMKELNELSADLLDDEALKALKNATVVQDMFAISADTFSNMNVTLEKVDPLQLATLNVAKNFEASAPTLIKTFTNAGINDVDYKIGSVTIDGKTFTTLEIKANAIITTMYQTLIGIKCNGYFATVTVTSNKKNTVKDLMECFYLVK